MNLRAIAVALGGEVAGRSVLAPRPGGPPRDRGLHVTPMPGAPDGLLVKLFSGSGRADDLAAKDFVLERLGLRSGPGWAPPERRSDERQQAERADMADRESRRARALTLWHEARDPAGTVVERYLASRMIALDSAIAGPVLRFHHRCPFREGAEVVRAPAMLALMRSVESDEPMAVHRTRLTGDGQKVDRRMLGPAGGCAIKLDADDGVTGGLVLGEGIETVMTARELGLRPAWAMGSVGGIASFPVLSGIEAVTFLEERDESGASARAVHACGARWHEAGREVIVVRPTRGSDLNDAVRGIGA